MFQTCVLGADHKVLGSNIDKFNGQKLIHALTNQFFGGRIAAHCCNATAGIGRSMVISRGILYSKNTGLRQ
jgi:hypothetical protein